MRTTRPYKSNVPRRDVAAGVAFLCVLGVVSALGFAAARLGLHPAVTVAWVVLISVVTYNEYGADKRAAEEDSWRTSESTLLWLSFLGGTPGAVIGSQVFRHKTSKITFRCKFWTVVVAQGAIALGVLGILNQLDTFLPAASRPGLSTPGKPIDISVGPSKGSASGERAPKVKLVATRKPTAGTAKSGVRSGKPTTRKTATPSAGRVAAKPTTLPTGKAHIPLVIAPRPTEPRTANGKLPVYSVDYR